MGKRRRETEWKSKHKDSVGCNAEKGEMCPENGVVGHPLQQFQDTRALSMSRSEFEKWTIDIFEKPQGPVKTVSGDMLHSGRSSLKPPSPIAVKFVDVVYKVNLEDQTSWWNLKNVGKHITKKSLEKTILHGVSGVVFPGQMLAMLGPSGSGKTTLLNILGGRLKGNITGTILYNDMPYSKAMKRRTGFVTQDDVLFPHLTVRETLVYAALLRLPSKFFSRREKVMRAEAIIKELGLEKCADTIIGGPFLRGISGGERKRVSIGHEMLTDPSLILLDEPTSGLDSTTALRIINTLRDLAQGGRTIIATIHQPSSRVYNIFDKLILLSDGYPLYFGPRSAAMDYFASIGLKPFPMNPADFLLDLASGIMPDVSQEVEEGVPAAKSEEERGPSVRTKLFEAYQKNLDPNIRSELNIAPHLTVEKTEALEKRKWPTTWWEQFSVLLFRGLKERRHEAFAGLRIAQVLAIAIVCGLLWWRSSTSQIQDQVGLLFFLSTFWGFFPLFSAIFTFPKEQSMLAKERASGMYRLTAYFFARTIGDLPLELVLPTAFVIIVYWMGGLRASVGSFFLTLGVVLYIVLISQGLGLALGAALMDVKQATTLASVIMLTFLLAGGYFVQRTPSWIGWIKYLSFTYYAYKLQLAAQYAMDQNQTYVCLTGRCRIADYPDIREVGLGHTATAVMALAIMLIGYRVIAYIALRKMRVFDH